MGWNHQLEEGLVECAESLQDAKSPAFVAAYVIPCQLKTYDKSAKLLMIFMGNQ